ncbi:GGDEF domain-containing protein [Pararhizobium antarcticum]|uniref:diguanylate cyclase n=1 Tax=Pararhizobium antarcticum TaxID=1798805 RepID=A0A657LU18_9HYPH|nr:diguanylate cyclase [Pararhizobium antarcticum]OJF91955.1 diguanylate cyclase response regulator [Rhizobium sp. 58]OJF98338.1 diguanylate cyclase response regulator [Pararhizobium antarcticum]
MLLVEDSRMFSTALKHGLETAHGVSVTHCSSLQALKTLFGTGQADFSLAVLDLNLPDAPNCEALEFVLSKGIAVIVFTATFNDATRDYILSKNVVDCVLKNQMDSIGQVMSAVDRALTNSKTHVLLADSDADSRSGLASLLVRQQFRVTAVDSGTQVLERLEGAEAFDLVVTNINLSDMSGHWLLAEIRLRYGEDALGVIAVDSSGDRQQAARFLRNGGTEFIQSPFLVDEFISRIFHVASIQNRVQALHNIAARDYLTDLYNRRHFFQVGPRLVDQCLRRGGTTCIAILDIDHFKRLNDTYGHEVGDLVLTAVARRLRAQVGEEHLLARLGGEEFGILFNSLNVADASRFCEDLRLDLASAKVTADDEELSVTVSIGLAIIEGRESFDNYLNAADQFLYMAKYDGRNRTVSELTLLNAMAS